MTIEEIRAASETLTLEQLQTELWTREKTQDAARPEKLEIRRLMEPRIIAAQRASQVAGSGRTTILKVGGK
jgi:hypothetical protein